MNDFIYIAKIKKKKRKEKKLPWVDWKIRQDFCIYTQSSRTGLSNKLIASGLLMLWIIQQ